MSQLALKTAQALFKTTSRVVFIDIEGKTEFLGATKSRYNLAFIPYSIKVVLELLKAGFPRSNVAIMSAHIAKVATY